MTDEERKRMKDAVYEKEGAWLGMRYDCETAEEIFEQEVVPSVEAMSDEELKAAYEEALEFSRRMSS